MVPLRRLPRLYWATELRSRIGGPHGPDAWVILPAFQKGLCRDGDPRGFSLGMGGPHEHDPTGTGRHPDGDRPIFGHFDGRRGRTLLRPDLRLAVASEAVALYPHLGDLRPR